MFAKLEKMPVEVWFSSSEFVSNPIPLRFMNDVTALNLM